MIVISNTVRARKASALPGTNTLLLNQQEFDSMFTVTEETRNRDYTDRRSFTQRIVK